MDPLPERRESDRHHDKSSVTVAFFNTENYHSARCLNFSREGICFELDFPLKPGTIVFIRRDKTARSDMDADFQEGFRSVSVANVKWCKEITDRCDSGFGVGAKYYYPW